MCSVKEFDRDLMIDFYKADSSEYEECREYCGKHKIGFPLYPEAVFIARNPHAANEIVGVCAIKKVFEVEPLCADQGTVARVLAEKAMAVISLVSNEVQALVKKDTNGFVGMLERYGFTITDREMIILKKRI